MNQNNSVCSRYLINTFIYLFNIRGDTIALNRQNDAEPLVSHFKAGDPRTASSAAFDFVGSKRDFAL